MKKLVVLLLTLAILVTAGLLIAVTAQADDSLPPEEEKKGMHKEEEGPKVSEDYRYLNEDEFAALTEEQQEALRALDEKSRMYIAHYRREEQIILGNITEDEPRLNLETAKQIIADFESGKCSEETIGMALYNRCPYYDYAGGSGISVTRYWLDDLGTKEIIVFMDSDVYYYEYNTEGDLISEVLHTPASND